MTQAHSPSPEAQQLALEVQQAFANDLEIMAQTLLDAGDHLFGETEFQIRAQVLKLAQLLYEKRLAQKKMATTAPAKPAPTAKAPPTSKTTDPETS